MNLQDKTQVSDLVVALLAAVLAGAILALGKAVLGNPYNSYISIRKKTLEIIRNFKEPRHITDDSSLRNSIIFAQLDKIKIVVDLIDENSENRILSRFYNYKKISMFLVALYEYIRNPIQLPQKKEFEDDFFLNTDEFFKQIKKELQIPKYRILFGLASFFIAVLFLIFYAMR